MQSDYQVNSNPVSWRKEKYKSILQHNPLLLCHPSTIYTKIWLNTASVCCCLAAKILYGRFLTTIGIHCNFPLKKDQTTNFPEPTGGEHLIFKTQLFGGSIPLKMGKYSNPKQVIALPLSAKFCGETQMQPCCCFSR